jgi:tetratricopeptide (TPR) repeat protein
MCDAAGALSRVAVLTCRIADLPPSGFHPDLLPMSKKDKHRGRREPTLGNLDHVDSPSAPPPARDEELPNVSVDDDGARIVRRSRRDPAFAREQRDELPRVSVDHDEPRRSQRPRRSPPPRRERPPPHRARSSVHSWLWPLLAVLVVVILALAWVNQDRLRALLPPTQLNTMLSQADQALAAGHLQGDGSAEALYNKVLAREPDNTHALHGLHQVGTAELARASSAIQAHHFTQAKNDIASARRLLGGGSEVDAAEKALRQAKHPPKQVDATIAKARQAMAKGHVTGAKGAAALYQQVLKVDPDNAVARHGLEQAGNQLAAHARDALQQGDIDTAAALIAEMGKRVPHNGDLPALRARLSQARQATAAAIKTHLARGHKDLHAGRFTSGDDNALDQFQSVLKLDPGNQAAHAGLGQVAQALVVQADAAMASDDPAQAQTLLAQAGKLAPKSSDVAAAKARLASMGGAAPASSTLASVATGGSAGNEAHPSLTDSQQQTIRHLIDQAATAAKAGHIMLPPGESAYDLYRKALTIDGNNAKARAGLKNLAAVTVKHFRQALAAHRLERADGYLATLRNLEPDASQTDALDKELADAWIDRAQARVDQGNREAALKALAAAQKLAPNAPRVKAMARRLH